MKYTAYFIFIGFIVLLLFFLKNALEPKEVPVMITGSDKCGECHQLQTLGNQNNVWKNSGHSASFISLTTDKAKDYASKNNLGDPAQNEACLKCHTTAGFLKDTEKQPSYKVEEGVGCESCHGAGSKYSPAEIMKDEALFKREGGVVGDEETCMKCHSPTANKEKKLKDNSCPLQDEDFNYKSAWEKIKHPLNKDNFK